MSIVGSGAGGALKRGQLPWLRRAVKAPRVQPLPPQPLEVRSAGALRGEIAAPGDKSITHRALLFSALAIGRSRIARPLDAEDTRATAAALQALGARIDWPRNGDCAVEGFGVGGALQPGAALDLGNSGTGARLLAGLLAGSAVEATIVGDASLGRRPMDRIAGPLRRMGAKIDLALGGHLPMRIAGEVGLAPLAHRLESPSAQVKSALLIAALGAPGTSRILEPVPTRDHSEKMLPRYGAALAHEVDADGARVLELTGERELSPCDIAVPGDVSSAAFALVAALLVPGSEVNVTGVAHSPTRAALFDTLRRMGADLAITPTGDWLGDPLATITAKARRLDAIDLTPAHAAAMIDELPIFFVAAALAHGRTRATGLGELRRKESDRLRAMATGLRALGAGVEEQDDALVIEGSSGVPLPGGAAVSAFADHRVAMSLMVAGLWCAEPITIDDMRCTKTSYPGFLADMHALGAL